MRSQSLNICRKCGGKAGYFTRYGIIRDEHGELKGYATTCYCLYSGHKVRAYGDTPQEAERKAADWWNRGIYDITDERYREGVSAGRRLQRLQSEEANNDE